MSIGSEEISYNNAKIGTRGKKWGTKELLEA